MCVCFALLVVAIFISTAAVVVVGFRDLIDGWFSISLILMIDIKSSDSQREQ